MRYRVVFRAAARIEAMDAADFILAQGYPETAARWYQGLRQTIDSLAAVHSRASTRSSRSVSCGS